MMLTFQTGGRSGFTRIVLQIQYVPEDAVGPLKEFIGFLYPKHHRIKVSENDPIKGKRRDHHNNSYRLQGNRYLVQSIEFDSLPPVWVQLMKRLGFIKSKRFFSDSVGRSIYNLLFLNDFNESADYLRGRINKLLEENQ